MSGHIRWFAPAWTTRSDSQAGSAHAPQHRFASLCGCKRQTGRSTINMGKAEQQKAQGAACCANNYSSCLRNFPIISQVRETE